MKKLILTGICFTTIAPIFTTSCGPGLKTTDHTLELSNINFEVIFGQTGKEILYNLIKILKEENPNWSLDFLDYYAIRNEGLLEINDSYIAQFNDEIVISAQKNDFGFEGVYGTRVKDTRLDISKIVLDEFFVKVHYDNSYELIQKELNNYLIKNYEENKVNLFINSEIVNDINKPTKIGPKAEIKLVALQDATKLIGEVLYNFEFKGQMVNDLIPNNFKVSRLENDLSLNHFMSIIITDLNAKLEKSYFEFTPLLVEKLAVLLINNSLEYDPNHVIKVDDQIIIRLNDDYFDGDLFITII